MAFSLNDLAQRLFMYDMGSLTFEDFNGGVAASGSGDIFPDKQTVFVGAVLSEVPEGWGSYEVVPYWGGVPSGDPYTRIFTPPVAHLYWLPDARLIRVDQVVYTEQYFLSPYAGDDTWVHWVCPAPAKLALWRGFNPSFS